VTRRSVVLGVVACALAVAAGCGVPSDGDARPIAPDQLPEGLGAPESTTTIPAPESTQIVQLFYVRQGSLVPTIDEVSVNASLNEIMAALTSGPVDELANVGFRSALGGADVVRDVSLSAGVARVDLTPAYTQIPPGDQVLGLGEIVLTLTAQAGVGQVQFTLDGQPIIVPSADGTIAAGPVSRDNYAALLAV